MEKLDPKTKYWLEDNKDKFYIGGAVLALGLIGLGAFTYFNKENNYNIGEGVEVVMADYILTHKENGDLELLDVDKNESVSTYDMEDDAITFHGENLDEMFIYDNNKIQSVNIDADGELSLIDVLNISTDITDVIDVQKGGENYGFLTPNDLIITDKDGTPIIVFEDNEANVYHLADRGVYLAVDTEIHFVDYEDSQTQYIDIGDVTTKFSQHGDTIVARNDFGSGEDIESVLNMEDGNLFIDDLKRVQYENKIDILTPQTENQLVYIQLNTNDDGEITRQDLATLSINEKSETDENIHLSDFTLPLDTTETFGEDKTLSSRGFIYDETETGLRIIEMRNGREATRLSNERIKNFVPIYTK